MAAFDLTVMPGRKNLDPLVADAELREEEGIRETAAAMGNPPCQAK